MMASTSGVCRLDVRSSGISSLSSRCPEPSVQSSMVIPTNRLPSRRFTVRNAATEGSQTQTAQTQTTSAAPSPPPAAAAPKTSTVTIEYQRQKAKELVQYFEERKVEEQIRKDRIFGWTRKNEIGNGRWVMFGIAVGLLTEYATGSNFIDQLKIIVSNLGILDLE